MIVGRVTNSPKSTTPGESIRTTRGKTTLFETIIIRAFKLIALLACGVNSES
jgi:hypothetical protein